MHKRFAGLAVTVVLFVALGSQALIFASVAPKPPDQPLASDWLGASSISTGGEQALPSLLPSRPAHTVADGENADRETTSDAGVVGYDGAEIVVRQGDNGRRFEINEDQTLVISLPANPSTGYTWTPAGGLLHALSQLGEAEFVPYSDQLGSSGVQVLRFKPLEAGDIALSLVYHRPWEKKEPLRDFSVRISAVGDFVEGPKGLIDTPATADSKPSSDGPLIDDGTSTESLESPAGLPSSLNWCSAGGCTGVKDQGSCGGCWAFSTAGVLESAVKIKDGVERDLSEQHLISCNTDGFGCGGGWWAFNYYVDQGDADDGAVYEADFPYRASDVSCSPPYVHHETITSWNYAESSVAGIKQAIHDQGPIAVAVCVGDRFQNYTSGVMETDESSDCPDNNPVNHGVILVGWDDSLGTSGAWRLKNSWGSGWGESGYMWIGYGVSRVGYGSAYVNYAGGGGSTNTSPYTPSSPTPSDGATGQSITADLSWSGGDPDGESVTYDVYLAARDSTPDKLICDRKSRATCDPGTLSHGTTYYWQVVAEDSQGAVTEGPVWDFTTAETAKADFYGDPTQGVAPLDVTFTDLSTGDYSTCSWDFGDGGTSSACGTVLHTYQEAGTYTVMLEVSGAGGNSAKTRSDYVTVTRPPQLVSDVRLSQTPSGDVFVGDEVHFVADAEGSIPLTYTWTVDGALVGETSNHLEKVFQAGGTYDVGVTVSNGAGEAAATIQLVVQEPDPEGQPDLSRSFQMVNPSVARSGAVLTYTTVLYNDSSVDAEAVLADSIPTYAEYVAGSAQASDGGKVTFDNGDLHWSGQVGVDAPVVIVYRVSVIETTKLEAGAEMTSSVRLQDGFGNQLLLQSEARYKAQVGMELAGGALYTRIPTVTVGLDHPEGVFQVWLEDEGRFIDGSGWTDAAAPASWELDSSDGVEVPLSVYAVFQDENGEQYGPVKDDILYDPTPPRVTRAEVVNQIVRVGVADEGSGVEKVQISDDSAFETFSEAAVLTDVVEIQIPWDVQTEGGVLVRAVDRAGNYSEIRGAQNHGVYLPLVIRRQS